MEKRKNTIHEIEFTGYTAEGLGVGRIEDLVVFVPGVIQGERWKVRLEKVKKTVAWGRGVTLLSASPERVPCDCPCVPRCGGCQFRHMSYEEELRAKRQRVDDALHRVGGLSLSVSEILGAATPYRYRNKVQFPVAPGKNGPAIGFYRSRSHDVIPVEDCLLQPEEANILLRELRKWMSGNPNAPAYDEVKHTGLVRHLFVRFASSGILCCLVVNAPPATLLRREAHLLKRFQAAVPRLTGFVINYNMEKTNVILGNSYRLVWGQDWLEDTLNGFTFRISVPSFYQVNHGQCERLYQKAVELADLKGTETVLDLYCGAGTISLSMARSAGRVIGAEIVPEAIEDARANAARNGITNAEFFCGDAGAIAAKLEQDGIRPDVICVDPPRKGLSPEVVDTAAAMSPSRIVYISCDPATLARDLKRFAGLGYEAVHATAVDMFPRTSHVECAVLLSRTGTTSQDPQM